MEGKSCPSVVALIDAARGSADPLDDIGVPSQEALLAPGSVPDEHTESSPVLAPVTEPNILRCHHLHSPCCMNRRFRTFEIWRCASIVAWLNVVDEMRLMLITKQLHSTVRQLSWVLHSLILPVLPSPSVLVA